MSKQKLDEIRTLAIKLFEASRKAKVKYWGRDNNFLRRSDLRPSGIAEWDAVAVCAIEQLGGRKRK